LPEFGPIIIPADGAMVDEQWAFAVAVVQKSAAFIGIRRGVREIASPIRTHARPVHAHEYEQVDVCEIMKGRRSSAYADAVVWEPRANQSGLGVDWVKCRPTD
jgi:hypothetical protein